MFGAWVAGQFVGNFISQPVSSFPGSERRISLSCSGNSIGQSVSLRRKKLQVRVLLGAPFSVLLGMTKFDFAWLTGLLEGEGSFIPGPPSNRNQPVISVSMTDEDVIARVARLWSMSYCPCSEGKCAENGWKVPYRTALRGAKAVALMLKLKPHMSTRRQSQIREAVDSYDPELRRLNSAKITPDAVVAIRSAEGTNREVGAVFGVSHATISRIRSGKQWRRLPRLHKGSA